MATHGQGFISIRNGQLLKFNGRERYFAETNAEGRFEFAPIAFEKEGRRRLNQFGNVEGEIVDFVLFFLHTSGFKRITQQDWEALDESKTVTLEPWGQIEGTVMVRTQPGNAPAALVPNSISRRNGIVRNRTTCFDFLSHNLQSDRRFFNRPVL